jgi:hypothetical protein
MDIIFKHLLIFSPFFSILQKKIIKIFENPTLKKMNFKKKKKKVESEGS